MQLAMSVFLRYLHLYLYPSLVRMLTRLGYVLVRNFLVDKLIVGDFVVLSIDLYVILHWNFIPSLLSLVDWFNLDQSVPAPNEQKPRYLDEEATVMVTLFLLSPSEGGTVYMNK